MPEPANALTRGENVPQESPRGRLHHLITLEGLSRETLSQLLDEAEAYLAPPEVPAIRSSVLAGVTVANLFFEPSTRTRASFELAAKRLGADVLNLDVNTSSRKKGESILDTIYTLEAMQCDVFVVRDADVGVPQMIANAVRPGVRVLNAGEGSVSHPTQGLLDALTARRVYPDFGRMTLAIVGDIAHSRVARSAFTAFSTLGAQAIHLVGPASMLPAEHEYPGALRFTDLDAGIATADVVMALRIQHERIAGDETLPGMDEYHRRYGITAARLAALGRDPWIMHPGPMNRGVEIDDAVADGPRSLITQQVRNGVAVRMALLAQIAAGRSQ